MRLINHRYRIIDCLKKTKLSTTYLVSDMFDESKEYLMHILNQDYIPGTLIDFYTKEFINFINLNNDNIIKTYSFNVISYIDHKKITSIEYFYITQLVKNQLNFLDYIKDKSVNKIIDIFIELCSALNYLSIKGYYFDSLNPDKIIIRENSGTHQLMLKDLASVELDKQLFNAESNAFFKLPATLNRNSIEAIIYSLGLIFLIMLKKDNCILNPLDELRGLDNNLLNVYKNNDDISLVKKLLPLIEQLLVFDGKFPYTYLYHFVNDLNVVLGTNYNLVSKENNEKLYFHTKMIGRNKEINTIMQSYDDMKRYKPFKKVFLIDGNTGTGKTRFLEEVKFLLEIKNASVYSSFSLDNTTDSSNKMWVDILKKIVLESDSDTIDKYEKELMKFFPEIIDNKKNVVATDYLLEDNTKYRLLNRIAGFINDSVKNDSAVIIIDNVHYANEFTIDTLSYFYSEVVRNKNIILIFSYKEEEIKNSSRVMEFIKSFMDKKDVELLTLDNLSLLESGEFLKNILSLDHVPLQLSERIYSQSYGNPLFISEVIKDFFNRKIIFISERTGLWNISLPEDRYSNLSIPESVEHALLNQLKDIDSLSLDVLKVLSVFTEPQSISVINEFLHLELLFIEQVVQKLVDKGIVGKKYNEYGSVYHFNNKVLKDIVYNRIDELEKIEKHKLAATILEENPSPQSNYNELIMHFEKSNNIDKVIQYCILNANKMKRLKNTKEVVVNLEKAISISDNIEQKVDLLTNIGLINFDIGNYEYAINIFKNALELSFKTDNKKKQVDILLYLAYVYATSFNNIEAIKCIDDAGELLKRLDYEEGNLESKRILAIIYLNKNQHFECERLCLEVINDCGDRYPKTKGHACRTLAHVYSKGRKIEQALELYKMAYDLFIKIDETRGSLICLNNLGGIYIDIYQDSEKALYYFNSVTTLSEEYNFVLHEINGLINIAFVYSAIFNYEQSYVYAKLALDKLLERNFKAFYNYNLLTKLCLKMDNYTEAFYFHNLILKELELSRDQGLDIVEYYNSSAELFNAVGDFEESISFCNKAIDFYKDGLDTERFIAIILLNINKIRISKSFCYEDELTEIISTSQKFATINYTINSLCQAVIVLSEKQDYENANRLLLIAEEAMKDKIHDEALARYYLAKGAIVRDYSSVRLLLTALDYAKKVKSKSLIAKITLSLGDFYFELENYYYSANYYIEACEVINGLVCQIPEKYKLMYMNNFNYSRAYYRIQYIKDMVINEDVSDIFIKNKEFIASLEELYQLLTGFEVTPFLKNKTFMSYISEQFKLNYSNGISNEFDLLTKLGNDSIKNIELVIKYVSTATLATSGYVVTMNSKQEFSILSSLKETDTIPSNINVLDRVRLTMKPVCISNKLTNNEIENALLPVDVKACLCLPIMNNNSIEDKVKNISGYLYLESDLVLNNFNEDGLQKCQEFINLLALLIEKHQLMIEASLDKLTGALTRKYLEDKINETIVRCTSLNEKFSMIMYDIDRFKNVNDRFGHLTGDEVLKKITKIAFDCISKMDSIGRYGGEEFIVILPNKDSDEALAIAEKIRKKISQEKILSDKAEVSISLGVATFPDHGQNVTELVEKVDQALYNAKENGRNKSIIWKSNFKNNVKTKDKLSGIITGNQVIDSRNILALVELIEIAKKNISKVDKIHNFLGRIIEIVNAQYGNLLVIEKGTIIENYGRKYQEEEWFADNNLNESVIESVIQSKQGQFLIDWTNINKHDLITGLPDWNSLLVVPITSNEEIKGIIYLSVSTRVKEFGTGEQNFISVLSDLASYII